MENGKTKGLGVAVDNIGIYEWRDNENCEIEEIEAVGAGYPVSYSSVKNDMKHLSYMLDGGRNGLYWGWCPLHGN